MWYILEVVSRLLSFILKRKPKDEDIVKWENIPYDFQTNRFLPLGDALEELSSSPKPSSASESELNRAVTPRESSHGT